MIGIIGAMEEEVAALLKRMEKVESKQIAKTVFHEGELSGIKVVLLQSGIGKVNAAISTTLLFEHYPIKSVINIGTAGGIKPDAEVLDLVISTHCAYHDADATSFGYSIGQIPQMPLYYRSDEKMINTLKPILDEAKIPYHEGLIVSGDSFIARKDQIEEIRANFPQAIATEMESTAIAQVCYVYEKPFIILRSLSDIAGKESHISFDECLEQASERSAKFISTFVTRLSN